MTQRVSWLGVGALGLVFVAPLSAQQQPAATNDSWQVGIVTLARHITTDAGDEPCPDCDGGAFPIVTTSQEFQIETSEMRYYAGMVVSGQLPVLPLRPPDRVRFAIEHAEAPHVPMLIIRDDEGREYVFSLLREQRKPVTKPGL